MSLAGKFAPIIVGLFFVLTASIHRMGLGSEGYTTSPLVGINIFGILVMMIMLVGLIIWLLITLVTKRRASAKQAGINLIGVLILMFAAMYIDAPTILYAS